MFLEYFGIIGDIGYLIGRPDNDRIYTTFSGPYEFSAFFSMMTCFNFYRLIKTKDGKYILSIIFMMIGIVISQSRISLLAVIITCMIILFYNLRKGKVFFLTSGIMLLLIPIFINITNLEAFNRFKDIDISSTFNTISIAWEEADFEFYHKTGHLMYSERLLASSTDKSFVFRMTKWVTLGKETLKTPFFGIGPSIVGEGMDGSYARIFCECGLLGIISWLVILISLIKIFKRYYNKSINPISVILYCLMIIAIFIDVFEASKIMMIFWAIVGFLLANVQNEDKKKFKIAHVVDGFNFGGVESVIYNYYSNMQHLNNYENIIISHGKINKNNEKLYKPYNFKFYEVTPKRINIFKNFIELLKLFYKERPDIIHVHMTLSSFIALFAGFLIGVEIRICHSHLSLNSISFSQRIYKFLCNIFANVYFACSRDAAHYLFYKNNEKKCYIINNAFNIERFKYDKNIRKNIREELKITGQFVVGNIGRFTSQKNHEKILGIFEEILKINENSILLLIGEGELKKDIESEIIKKNLLDKVIMLDNQKNIENYYQAMDVFLFPSRYEGLGIVVVEAQTSGLPCYVSDAIPKDVEVTDLVRFMSLNLSNKQWAKKIINWKDDDRKSYYEKLKNSCFDIKQASSRLSSIYNNLMKKYGV